MKTIQYPRMCKDCNGTGQIADVKDSTCPFRQCPVCNSTGIIIVTETETSDLYMPSNADNQTPLKH